MDSECLQKTQNIPAANQTFPTEKKLTDKQLIGDLRSPCAGAGEDRRSMKSRTEDHVKRVLRNVYALIDEPIDEMSETYLTNRLENIQVSTDFLNAFLYFFFVEMFLKIDHFYFRSRVAFCV